MVFKSSVLRHLISARGWEVYLEQSKGVGVPHEAYLATRYGRLPTPSFALLVLLNLPPRGADVRCINFNAYSYAITLKILATRPRSRPRNARAIRWVWLCPARKRVCTYTRTARDMTGIAFFALKACYRLCRNAEFVEYEHDV